MARVVGLWRFPVKSAGGERLQHARVTTQGLVGDRVWAVVDEDGNIVSAKHPARGGRLLQVSCRYSDASGETALQIPGGPEVVAGTTEADEALSAWLARPVHLTNDPVPGAMLRRWWPSVPGLVPEWEAEAAPGTDAVTSMGGPALRGSFVDYGAIHVVFSHELQQLAAISGHQIDPRRFRPNVAVEGGRELHEGRRQMRIGPLLIDVDLPTPRCAVPGLSPDDASLDAELLRALAKHDRRPVGSRGNAACFGLYAAALTDGTLNMGDSVTAE